MKKYILSASAMFVLMLTMAVVNIQAQSQNPLTANIPFDFQIGDKRLPAGEYQIRVVNQSSDKTALLVKSADGKVARMVLTQLVQSSKAQEKASMVFNRYGDQYFLAQVWTAADNFGLALTKSRAERSMERELAMEMPKSDMARRSAERVTVSLASSKR
jgi:hypothetical protein